ncbi:MAG: hypothetical protein HUK15_04840, partial [Bacteroidales bacterium]|nr:hypothetical protein [Bacteroidales bacterium]
TYTYRQVTSDDGDGGVALPTLVGTNVVNDRYANGEMSTIYAIVQLKNKEIVLHQNINTFYLRNDNGSGESYQDNGYERLTLTPRK